MADLINPYAAKPTAEVEAGGTTPPKGLVNPYAAPSPTETPTRMTLIPTQTQQRGVGKAPLAAETTSVRNLLERKEGGVNYETGIPDAKLTAKLSILTKPEQQSLLENTYGAENVATDAFGNWILKPGGFKKAGITPPTGGENMPIAILPKDRWTAARAAGHAGEVLPMAGATIGAAAASPAGPLAGMGAVGLGTAAGEAANALIAQSLGLAQRTPGQQAAELAKAGVYGAMGEGAARGLMKLGRATAAPYAEFSPLPADILETGRKAATMGLVPRVGAANPKSFLGAREQGLIEAGFGFPAEAKNIDILRAEAQRMVQQTGGIGASPQAIVRATERKLGDIGLEFTAAKNRATQLVDDSVQRLQTKFGKATPIEAQRDIEAAFKTFHDEATDLYGKADKLVGNRPVVPTMPVANAARGILASLPKTAEGKPLYDPEGVAVQFLRNLTQMPEMMSMQQMQALRSQLASSAEVRSLLASTGARNSEILRQAANDSFDQVGRALKGKGGAAVEALREADKFYAKGMEKFDLPIIRRMTLEARNTGSVPPEQVLQAITMPNSATNVGRIMGLVTPDTRQAIRRAHFDSMMTNAADPLTGKVSGVKLAGEIKRLKTTFPALYGKDAKSIQTLANQLAALDGKLDPALLKTGNITTAIKQSLNAEQALKRVSDDELFSQLARPGFESGQAVDHLFRPNSPERITRALKFFGENSPEAKNIRAIAMGKLMNEMETSEMTRTGAKQTLSGKALEDALKLYGRPTVDAMFGKDLSAQLHEFAKVSEMATAKNPHLSSIAMASIMLNPFSHVKALAELFTMGKVMSSPQFIKWLTEGYRYPPPLARGTAAFTRAASLAQAIQAEQPGIGGDTALDKGVAAARQELAGVPIIGAEQPMQPGAQQ